MFLMAAMAVTVLGVGVSSVTADEAVPTTPADAKAVDAKTEIATPAQLRAKLHRTLADLIDARNVEKPDPARVDKLVKEIERLRAEIAAQRFFLSPGSNFR
jgi:hypothetical protein